MSYFTISRYFPVFPSISREILLFPGYLTTLLGSKSGVN